ncbi:enoyl-CoA hydratase-related protein [Bacillus piscicola]|uniref:enoyl-CoA hydratase-related protein n=1 Tax=Bacillus piscicola TaxID=1632684 RepID=UPI001F0940D9|nr:enoyl-CoA hydratase-related protein [Bacillus piscicola]
MGDCIYAQTEGSIATIYLNRPGKRNAISIEMWEGLGEIVEELRNNSKVRAVVIRGQGERSFSAGADIGEFNSVRASSQLAKEYNTFAEKVEQALLHLNKPTIAMIQGYCIGAGCEIALTCDLRFASSDSIFAITPAKLGMVYNLFGIKQLVDLVGPAHTKDILYSGRKILAEEAKNMGLVNQIYPPEDLKLEVYKYAERIAANSLTSIQGSKKIVQDVCDGVQDETDEMNRRIYDSFDSEDYQEGITAFLNKRKPNFNR